MFVSDTQPQGAAVTYSTGQRVVIDVPADHAFRTTSWFPQHEATGTVERVFKNGTVAVAVDQVRNLSDDGLKTLHFDADHLRPLHRCYACDELVVESAMIDLDEHDWETVVSFHGFTHCAGPAEAFDADGNVIVCESCVDVALAVRTAAEQREAGAS